jgi:hypothetical protein
LEGYKLSHEYYAVTSYLMKITQIRDQLVEVGEKVDDTKLVNTTLNGFSNPWESFVKGICAQEKLPTFERLWDDCITTILTSLMLSLQETLCGCRPKVLGHLRNECFCIL